MQNVIGVKFKNMGKVYTFSPGDLDLKIDDKVVVESSVGLSLGSVAFGVRQIDENDVAEPIKTVLRKATEKDIEKYEELKVKAEKDVMLVKDKVKQLGLEMKIVSASYLLDGSKIVIEFSADDRVDFRELLKELASALKVRIELHQVGQRDEVKIKGGIGPCGEICCCSRFLKDFEHVTVKMAKIQGLSLNPTKISGLCGRLMCCLAYENKAYEEVLNKMPKVNSIINTPKGNGTVIYNDILRERVSVKVANGEDSFTVYDFALSELTGGDGDVTDKSELKEEKKTENINSDSGKIIDNKQSNPSVSIKTEHDKNLRENLKAGNGKHFGENANGNDRVKDNKNNDNPNDNHYKKHSFKHKKHNGFHNKIKDDK